QRIGQGSVPKKPLRGSSGRGAVEKSEDAPGGRHLLRSRRCEGTSDDPVERPPEQVIRNRTFPADGQVREAAFGQKPAGDSLTAEPPGLGDHLHKIGCYRNCGGALPPALE